VKIGNIVNRLQWH